MTVRIDGSQGEGGGQIIRTSVSLSALTGTPVEIENVRAKRSRPGLQPQHLAAVRAAAALCDAELQGDSVGSSRFVFAPRAPVRAGDYRFEIGTAGATGLVAQTVLLPLACASLPSGVVISGGTHLPHAPPADYLESVYTSALRRFAGVQTTVQMARPGFYPRGGGELRLAIEPSPPRRIDLTLRGNLVAMRAWVLSARLPAHVAQRGSDALAPLLEGFGTPVEVRDLAALGPGAAVGIAVECEGGAGGFVEVGEKGVPIETVAQRAFDAMISWWNSNTACDEHLADQWALPAALAAGESRWTTNRVTEHLRTVLSVIARFVDLESELSERADGTGAVVVRSRGLGGTTPQR